MIPSRATLRHWIQSRETPVFVQFTKYCVCGLAATATFLLGTAALVLLLPGFVDLALPPAERALHLNILHLVAFIPANLVSYLSNRAFVFTPGRHSKRREFALFTGIALLSVLIGLAAPEFLIRTLNVPNAVASLSFALTSAMVNFVTRKFFIFAR